MESATAHTALGTDTITHLDGQSLDIAAEKLAQLKAILPEAFAEGKLDVDKLKLVLGNDVHVGEERYGLNWPGKAEAYKEIQKRTTATLVPERDGSIDFDTAENVFIEGENLEVLRVLQKAYFGKVKMIYIDPPYNTGSEVFVYDDDFSETTSSFDARTAKRDSSGNLKRQDNLHKNTKDGARYHSNWLSMMLPRLYLGKNLLREDGLIFVSIDENEVASLKMLMTEVFGHENFVSQVVWQRHAGGGNDSRYFATDHEYIFCFAKNLSHIKRLRVPLSEDDISTYTQKDEYFEKLGYYKTKLFYRMRADDPRPTLQYHIPCPDGTTVFGEWKWEENEFKKGLAANKVVVRKDNKGKWTVEYKIYQKDDESDDKMKVPRSLITDSKTRNSLGKGELTEVLGAPNIFNNPKPTGLLKHLLNIGTSPRENHLILDFFGGSGSTAQAICELNTADGGNRKFICVQIDEEVEPGSVANENGFKTISQITKKRIQTVIKTAKNKTGTQSPGLRQFQLKPSSFLAWQPTISADQMRAQLELFSNSSTALIHDKESLVFELLLKAGIPLVSSIKTHTTILGTDIIVADNTLAFLLDKFDEECVPLMTTLKIPTVVCQDSIFETDQSKTNFALNCKENNISFQTV